MEIIKCFCRAHLRSENVFTILHTLKLPIFEFPIKMKIAYLIPLQSSKINSIFSARNKISRAIYFDSKEIYTKRADEYIGKIVIKGPHIDSLLDELRTEIMRNPHVGLREDKSQKACDDAIELNYPLPAN